LRTENRETQERDTGRDERMVVQERPEVEK
jgi:hypothetical protein